MLRFKADSVVFMTREGHRIKMPREQLTQGLALVALLLMAGMALFGPSGLLAWSEQSQLLEQRKAQIAQLTDERNRLQQDVDALDPENVDPDFAATIVREQLNVVHPDELVLELEPQK
ncbi:septum formation initiator family protein [Erythrobacter sp. SDW2]|uniref:FtsB family cell division protein n=1 Tax=Erythrobacter sp. SDW2 TaxID=2907154 RepID=UPI001F45989D|nr:septum formation initiator family protein [Erythrobacter sp. SDW2]UIP08205.1 septum formation initiator family protein [Erythrobacter sp. SDW2]